ncbi:MAG: ABC transporter ATP-binding protein [bacterium]|nr:ABC transporter ATP-binding protein [bacterium]
MNVIEVTELSKVYASGLGRGGIVALDGVSFSVEQGQIVGLLGPNGAGKTTLFKILLNITKPTGGRARLSGLPASDPLSRQRVGYLPENHRFPDHQTGIGLMELTARLYGVESSLFEDQLEPLLELVGMEKWGETKLRKYSKGMLQRIGLAQALVSDPEILLLDEPTDGVDPVGKIEIREALLKIRNQGKSIILNSHLLSEVESVADRVVILSKGKIVKSGSMAELTSQKSHIIIEAEIGHNIVEIPPRLGKVLSVSTKNMIVEVVDDSNLNPILELLFLKKIPIRSVKPMRISLEQSFLNTITEQEQTG